MASVSYTDALAKGTGNVAKAIAPTTAVSAISVFTDPTGHLWLAVTTDTTGFYLELERTE